jgi:peptidyl-prolyl cis-trans isomerase D
MMKWLRKHRHTIFLVTVGGFVVGSFMGFGSYFFSRSPYDAAIEVNGEPVSYKRYQTRLRQYMQNRPADAPPLDDQGMKALRQNVLQDLVREMVFSQEARRYGIEVTNNELAASLQRIPAFQRDGRFDPRLYVQVVQQAFRVELDEFEEDRRQEIRVQKLQGLLAQSVSVPPLEFQREYQKRMALGSPEERKKIAEKPDELREEIRKEQVNYIFQEWLSQVNNKLKVNVYLERWEGQDS